MGRGSSRPDWGETAGHGDREGRADPLWQENLDRQLPPYHQIMGLGGHGQEGRGNQRLKGREEDL